MKQQSKDLETRRRDLARDIRRKLGNDPEALEIVARKIEELVAKNGRQDRRG